MLGLLRSHRSNAQPIKRGDKNVTSLRVRVLIGRLKAENLPLGTRAVTHETVRMHVNTAQPRPRLGWRRHAERGVVGGAGTWCDVYMKLSMSRSGCERCSIDFHLMR